LEYAYSFPEYAKYFGTPSLLNKGIYGLVYNGSIPKDSSNPKLNHSILSTTTTTINGFAFYFLSTTCSMAAAMMPFKKNSKTLSAITLTLNF
jgi:hypothetical protein